jgi:hypothetical protein
MSSLTEGRGHIDERRDAADERRAIEPIPDLL